MQCMRVSKCIVGSLTTATCLAILLICAFLEDEDAMLPAIMPVNVIRQPGRKEGKVGSVNIVKTNHIPFGWNKAKPNDRSATTSIDISESPSPLAKSVTVVTKSSQRIFSSTIEGNAEDSKPTESCMSVLSSTSTEKILLNISDKVNFKTTSISFIPLTTKKGITESQGTTFSKMEMNITSTFSAALSTTTAWTTRREEIVRDRFMERKELLTKTCSISPIKQEENEGDRELLPKLSYYVGKYKLLACIPAKSGTTTWKIHMLRMKGYTKHIDNPHVNWVYKLLRARGLLNTRQSNKALQSPKVTRVISVRHPVTRLISAYTNKFYNGRLHIPDNVTYRFMQKALKAEGIEYPEGKPYAVSFPQFLNLILFEKRGGLERINNHWRPQYSLCDACSVPYDYMVKQETFEEDLQYLFKKLNVTETNASLKKNVFAKPSNVAYEDYFKNIPKRILRKIYNLYRRDFYHFGYEVPQYFRNLPKKGR